MFILLRLISSPHLHILSSSFSLLEWTWVLWCRRPAGPVLIKCRVKQRQGQSESDVGETKQLCKEITNFESLLIRVAIATKVL